MSRSEIIEAVETAITYHPGAIQFPEQLAQRLIARIEAVSGAGPGTGYKYVSDELDRKLDEVDWA